MALRANTLSYRLVSFFKKHSPEWIPSGDIQRLVSDKTKWLPRTAVRLLQVLKKKGYLEVRYGDKNHAWYRYKKDAPPVDKVKAVKIKPPAEPVTLFTRLEKKQKKENEHDTKLDK